MFGKEELEYLEKMEDRILQQSARNTQVIVENTILPQFKLLAEGQQMLLETLAPKSRVEELEDEVVMLKQAMRIMSQDIAELKKAQ